MKLGVLGGGHHTQSTSPVYQAGMAAAARGQALVDQSTADMNDVVGRTQARTDGLNQQLRTMARQAPATPAAPNVDAELAALKKEMGIGPPPASQTGEQAHTGGVTVSSRPGQSLANAHGLLMEE
ncbi:MAG TPA: hypothetical protein VGO93_01575 [Candidatus Xenobia bacterium]|jgi:hypothetical protein